MIESPSTRTRCVFYVDGYNWYHAIFKHRPEWKWLNLQSFFQAMRPHENIAAVKLFSAMVTDPDGCLRQETYFKALKSLPKLQIILGLFQPRRVHCKGDCKQEYIVQEEKKTDVNIAIEMMADAIDGQVDHICAVSGDSDLQPVIEWITKRFPKIQITVYVPCLPNERRDRRTDYYTTKGLNVDCRFLPLSGIPEHQLPNLVKLPQGGFAYRPSSWAAPGASQ
jgi:NYN domain-containing protein